MSAFVRLTARPRVPEVTAVAVTSVALSATVEALRWSQRQVEFGRVLLLSDKRPVGLAEMDIDWVPIPLLSSRAAYSQFMLCSLGEYIKTSHALVLQWDGFVRDGSAWSDDFLAYDYIGAPWPHHQNGGQVGNGGFSLRSRRLMEATRGLTGNGGAEDVTICRTYRIHLEERRKIRFADVDVAKRFSYERGISNGKEFGFHGVFNLKDELDADRMMQILNSVEPGVIGGRESTELLALALRTRDWPLARLALRHHGAHPQRTRRLLRMIGWLLKGQDGSLPSGLKGA